MTPNPTLTIPRPHSHTELLALAPRPANECPNPNRRTVDLYRKRTATNDAVPGGAPGEWELLSTCLSPEDAHRYGFNSAQVSQAFTPTAPTVLQTVAKLIAACDPSVQPRRTTEIRIVRALIAALQADGFQVIADNGEEAPVSGQDEAETLETLFAVDVSHLRTLKAGKRSFVLLVAGNGEDIISDYGCSLEDVIDPLIDSLETPESLAQLTNPPRPAL